MSPERGPVSDLAVRWWGSCASSGRLVSYADPESPSPTGGGASRHADAPTLITSRAMEAFSRDGTVADDLEQHMVRRVARQRRLRSEIEEAARLAAAYERLELQLAHRRLIAQ